MLPTLQDWNWNRENEYVCAVHAVCVVKNSQVTWLCMQQGRAKLPRLCICRGESGCTGGRGGQAAQAMNGVREKTVGCAVYTVWGMLEG